MAVRKIKGTYTAGCGVSGCRTRFNCHGQSSAEYTNESKRLVRYHDHSQFNLLEVKMSLYFAIREGKSCPFSPEITAEYCGLSNLQSGKVTDGSALTTSSVVTMSDISFAFLLFSFVDGQKGWCCCCWAFFCVWMRGTYCMNGEM